MLFRSDQPKRLRSRAVQALERRLFLAAHVAGDANVYATIQDAVDAATAGAIITVDPGTYAELVTVNKSLTIRGAQVDVDGRSNLRTIAANESIVSGQVFGDGSHSSGFYIIANDVTIDGFTVEGNTATTYGAGIVIGPGFSGTHIVNNVIENNIAGLYLANASPTDAALIQHNLFYNNNNPVGSNYGRGIYTDGSVSGGNLTNVIIDGNMFTRNLGAANVESAIGLEAVSAPQSNITISNNSFDANGKAVLAFNVNGLTITGNDVAWNRDYTSGGLRFEGGCSNVTITNNLLYDSEGRAIRIDLKAEEAHNTNFTITHNNIFGNGQSPDVNHDGLFVDAGTYDGSLDATNNYWGSADGPGGDGTGSGDHVYANGNSVTFSGWATSAFGPLEAPYYGVAWDVTTPLEAENFDAGGTTVAYSDNSSANLEQADRPYESVDIENTSDTSGLYDVTEVHATEYMNYTVNVPTAGTYTLDVRYAAAEATGGIFHVEIDGTPNVAGQWTLAGTGGDQTWVTETRAGYVLPAGQHILKIAFDQSGSGGYVGNFNWFQFVWAGPVAPTNLTASPIGTNINLAWTDNTSNETAFIVERKTNVGGAWQTLLTTAANATTAADPAFAASTTYFYRLHATTPTGDSAFSNVVEVVIPSSQPVDYLSHMTRLNETNGFGPAEKDESNGGSNAGDGGTITLNGVAYARGLGAHAPYSADVPLGGNYTRFLTDMGVDDEETTDSSIVFQVFNGATKLFDSGIMRPTSATQSLSLDVTGIQTLTLVITDAGDGSGFDHGDWAGARFVRVGAAMATIFSGTSGNDSYLLRQDASNKTQDEIVQNGYVMWSAAKSSVPNFIFNTGAGDDTLTVDYTNNSPIPTGGVFFDGGAGTGDSLIINGSPNADVATIANALTGPTAGNIAIGNATTGAQTVEGVTFNGGVGNDTLTVASGPVAGLTFNGGLTATDQDTLNLNAGAYTFNSDANLSTANLTLNVNNPGTSVQFMAAQHLAGLSIANANVALAADGTRVINTGTLAVTGTGKLDLSDNDMVVRAGTLGTWNGTGITRSIADGYDNGTWTGNGIITSQSQALALRARTTLGVAQASAVLNFGSGSTAVFDGQTVTGSAILVKYTYMGDTNLSGQLDGDDYFRIDSGFAGPQSGFANGDFDYSGTVNADDYFWLDLNYAMQPPKL